MSKAGGQTVPKGAGSREHDDDAPDKLHGAARQHVPEAGGGEGGEGPVERYEVHAHHVRLEAVPAVLYVRLVLLVLQDPAVVFAVRGENLHKRAPVPDAPARAPTRGNTIGADTSAEQGEFATTVRKCKRQSACRDDFRERGHCKRKPE